MKKTSKWLWGCVLIALGVILGLNGLGLTHINIFFPGWWTLFIIVPSMIGVLTDERKSGAVYGLVIGVCLLLACLDIIPFSILWRILVPAILILIGVSMLVHAQSNGEVMDRIKAARAEQKAHRRHKKVQEAEVVESDDDEDDEEDELESEDGFAEYWSTFGDQEVDYTDKTFSGCRVDAVFGGAEVDLRKAEITDKAILRTNSVFGGVVVYAPEGVKIEIASSSFFGKVSDKRKNVDHKKAKTTLFIDANCVFGSLEIR